MAYTYRIWDEKTPINGCPVDVAKQSLHVTTDNKLCLLTDSSGHDCITQLFPATATEDDVKVWVDKFNADMATRQKADEEAAKQPTLESRVASLEAAQLAGLGV